MARNGGGLCRARQNILQEDRVGFSFEMRDALLIAVVVGIDVDETIEHFAGVRHALGGKIQIEEPHESVEIFRFAIQLFVEMRDGLGERERLRVARGQALDLRYELGFPASSVHPLLGLREQRSGLLDPRPCAGKRAASSKSLPKFSGFCR